MKVSQDFNRNVQAANTEINKHLDKLKTKLDDPNISAAEKAEIEGKINNWQRGQVLLNSIASGLTAPTQSTAGIVAATASPALSYEIGQQFKKHDAEGTPAHILAHAILGAAVAAAGDNNALKESPNYPHGFRDIQNGTRKVNINNQSVLDDLRKVERGDWKKVYRDGFDGNGNKVSIHYFQNSRTGRVFNVKVKNYWSN